MVEVKGFKEGLEDVVAADSSICYIDGDRGILSYRGIDIHELAEHSTFEEICFLLWEGRLPRRDELDLLRRSIGAERALPPPMLELLASLVPHLTPMDAVRTMVSALAETDPDVADMSRPGNMRKALRMTGQIATIVAAHHRLPTIFGMREFVEAGGLMSYGEKVEELYRQLGIYAGRILKGDKPSDLPVWRPTRYEFVINRGTAKPLGIEVPSQLLAIADDVIE